MNERYFTLKMAMHMKFGGTRYASRWDASTWMLLVFVVVVCIWPVLLDGDWVAPVITASGLLLLFVVLFFGTYYRIDGDKLVVYQFFNPTPLPIDKISEIKPTKSILSAPATSLTHRIAISFSERKVLRSSMPLIISPIRQDEFIAQLKSINPDIRVESGRLLIR